MTDSDAPQKSGLNFDQIIVILCLVALGYLCGGYKMAIAGPVLALLGIGFLNLLLGTFNSKTKAIIGADGIAGIITHCFVILLPFTILALVSTYWLKWNAAQVFASSGLMVCGASIGAEMVKNGGGRFLGAFLPTLWCMFLSTTWMLLPTLIARVIG